MADKNLTGTGNVKSQASVGEKQPDNSQKTESQKQNDELVQNVMAQREELLKILVAKYKNYYPENIKQVIKQNEEENTVEWSIYRKDELQRSVYLIGPVDLENLEQTEKLFAQYEEQLIKENYAVINPLKSIYSTLNVSDEWKRKQLINFLIDADYTYFIDGWQKAPMSSFEAIISYCFSKWDLSDIDKNSILSAFVDNWFNLQLNFNNDNTNQQ